MTPSARTGVAFPLQGRRIYVAGHRGMVGSALVRRLEREDVEVIVAGREELDLRDQQAVRRWLRDRRPDAIVLAAARVGGIVANRDAPADFLSDNLLIQSNVIEGAFRSGVGRLLFLGSSCIYPRLAPQPIPEDALLTGPLEPTNEAYAIAKIAGLKLCQYLRRQHGVDYISAMPTNLYGPGDNFDTETSHVVPALIRRMHEAKAGQHRAFPLWGTGTPRREFLHVDDAADALAHMLTAYSDDIHLNIGCGEDLTIRQLANEIAAIVGYQGEIITDPSRPDGTPRKLLDVSRLFATGWRPSISLRDGLAHTYDWYRQRLAAGDGVRDGR